MAFVARGLLGTEEVLVAWDKGVITGDQPAVEAVQAQAQALEGSQVGPHEGPYTYENHLASDLSAFIIMNQVVLAATFTGDLPERPAIPEGAVG